jgi:hypothetical protein
MAGWLPELRGRLDPNETALVDGLTDLLNGLRLPALDVDASEAVKDENGLHIALAHQVRGRIVNVEAVGEIVVSYGVEHGHFAADDAEIGRVWPFRADDHIAQALSFLRYLLTGRIELHVWRRPAAVKTRSYWIAEDGSRELFLKGGTVGPFFGWSKVPEIIRFDFTIL